MLDTIAKEAIQRAQAACEDAYNIVQGLTPDTYTDDAMACLSECIGVLEFIAK
jgi:hypothetical protein